jgi:hypothetical protein
MPTKRTTKPARKPASKRAAVATVKPTAPTMSIADLRPDTNNANKGTVRGLAMLEDSLGKYGAGRSILVDKHGNVIAGNKTLQAVVDAGLEIETVRTDGTKLVVVQRTDLDLYADPKARQLAYADNRVAQIDLEWDAETLLTDVQAGVDLAPFFDEDELAELISDADNISSGESDSDPLSRNDVPDAIWPSDNEWDVPVLDIQMQADAFDAPILPWGEKTRPHLLTLGSRQQWKRIQAFTPICRAPWHYIRFTVNVGLPATGSS